MPHEPLRCPRQVKVIIAGLAFLLATLAVSAALGISDKIEYAKTSRITNSR